MSKAAARAEETTAREFRVFDFTVTSMTELRVLAKFVNDVLQTELLVGLRPIAANKISS